MCGRAVKEIKMNKLCLLKAIRTRDSVSSIRILLEKQGLYELEAQNEREDGTALFWAACLGMKDVVELLLMLGAEVNAVNCWKATPLHAAADTNRISISRILLQNGACINHQTLHGDTPCHLAAYRGYHDMVKFLTKSGSDLKLQNLRGYDVTKEALTQNHYKMVEWLYTFKKLENGSMKEDAVSKAVPVPKTSIDRNKITRLSDNLRGSTRMCSSVDYSFNSRTEPEYKAEELRVEKAPVPQTPTVSLARNQGSVKSVFSRTVSHSLARSSLDRDSLFTSERPFSWPSGV